jgi:tetratricopeptide (TPR) repeat protein
MGRMKQLDGCSTVSAFSWAVISGTLAVAAILGTICLTIAAFGPRGVVVGDVTLPASLIQRGFTTTIVARRLLDEVGRLREISLTNRVEAVLLEDTPASTSPAVKVAEGREVWERLLRAVSGSHTQAFTGEIVESHGSGAVPLYEGRLRYGDVIISDRRGASASSSVDALLRDMAFDIYRRLDPMRAAYAAWTFGDLDGMRLAMRPLLLASDTGPSVATAFFLLADLELKHGDLAAAEDHVLRGLGKSPRQAFGLHTWGRILQAKGLLAEALAVAAEACRHDMVSASGCTLLGEVHLEQAVLARGNPRHYRQAYQAFLRALSLDESSEAALAGAAQAAAASGDYPAALRLIDVALARAPLDTTLLLRKTWIMFRGGDLGYANRLLSELLEKNPDLLVRHPVSNSDAHLKLELARFADMRMPK